MYCKIKEIYLSKSDISSGIICIIIKWKGVKWPSKVTCGLVVLVVTALSHCTNAVWDTRPWLIRLALLSSIAPVLETEIHINKVCKENQNRNKDKYKQGVRRNSKFHKITQFFCLGQIRRCISENYAEQIQICIFMQSCDFAPMAETHFLPYQSQNSSMHVLLANLFYLHYYLMYIK